MSGIPTYYNNPFVDCLYKYNNILSKPIPKLSFSNKVLEVIKKILLAVAAPFVNLGLGFMALVSYPFAKWEKVIKKTEPKKEQIHNKDLDDNKQNESQIKVFLNKKLDLAIKSLKEEISIRGIHFKTIFFDLKTQEMSCEAKSSETGLLYRTTKSLIGEMIENLPESDIIRANWKISLFDGPHQHTFQFMFIKDHDKSIMNKFPSYKYVNENEISISKILHPNKLED